MHDNQAEAQPKKKHTMLKLVGLALAAVGVLTAKKVMMKSEKDKKNGKQE